MLTIEANDSGRLWSADPERWRELCTADGCPWCQSPGPPAEDVIADTDTCWVTAGRTAALPGYACVSTKAHFVEPYELPNDLRDRFFAECMAVARGLAEVFRPPKMNYEIHGNTVPHLHMHLYPRAADDAYVGYPITNRATFTRTANELAAMAVAVQRELSALPR